MAKAKVEKVEEVEAGDRETPSQIKMVKAALDELGADAKPQQLQDRIREKFRTELSKSIISNYKSTLKRKGELGGPGVVSRGRRGGSGTIQLEDLETVRGLVSRLGAEQVRRLVEVLA